MYFVIYSKHTLKIKLRNIKTETEGILKPLKAK